MTQQIIVIPGIRHLTAGSALHNSFENTDVLYLGSLQIPVIGNHDLIAFADGNCPIHFHCKTGDNRSNGIVDCTCID